MEGLLIDVVICCDEEFGCGLGEFVGELVVVVVFCVDVGWLVVDNFGMDLGLVLGVFGCG